MFFFQFQEAGCLWSGPLNGLKGHLNVCQKDALDCLNQCGAKIARTLMEDHMLYTCQKRLVTCSHCRYVFLIFYEFIKGKSLSEALIFASTNPQYNDRLLSQVPYMKIPSSNLGKTCCVQSNFCTQHVLPIFCKKKSF